MSRPTGQDDTTETSASRSDGWAGSLAMLILFIGVVSAVVGVVLPVNQATQRSGSVPVIVSGADVTPLATQVDLPDGATLTPATDELALGVSDLPAPVAALTEADHLVDGLLMLVGAFLLSRVIRDISAGRPFAPRTANRIAGIAVVVAALGVLPEIVRTVATIVVIEGPTLSSVEGIGFGAELDLGLFVLAAVLLVVAQVFRQGAQLAADTEGLV